MSDTTTAIELARGAGELLRAFQESLSPEQLGTQAAKDQGDQLSQQFLAEQLTSLRPRDSVLSEEATDSTDRLSSERVWIIDPLDGTREFSEGRDDWAVHVALWVDGELTAGAVALPGDDLVLSTRDQPLTFTRPRKIRLAVSRSRATPLVQKLATALDAELIGMGSAGYKVAAVVRGKADLYVHSGGQYEWDSAAPVAVARHAGLFTSRINGDPLMYNQADPYLPDLLVCNPHLSATTLELLGTILKED